MIYLLNILVLSVFSFLTLSVLPYLKVLGVTPFLVPFFIIALSYFRKGYEPLLLSAATGFFFDLFSPYPFGFYLLFFLSLSALVRFMFEEGLRSISFWHFLWVSLVSFVVYYGAQLAFIYFSGADFSASDLVYLGAGLLLNGLYGILVYAFSIWYFEKIIQLEDQLKRR